MLAGIFKNLFKNKSGLQPIKEKVVEEVAVEKTSTQEKNAEEKPLTKKEIAILEVMEKTGWSRKKTIRKMREIKEKYGISFSKYAKKEIYNIPEEELDAKCQEISYKIKRNKEKKAERKSREEMAQQEREESIQELITITGWDRETVEAKVQEARKRTGVGVKELEESVQEEVFLINHSRKIAKEYSATPELRTILCDKEMTNNYFPELVRRPWCVTNNLTLERFMEVFEGSDRIFYKPLGGRGGVGVKKYNYSKETAEEIYNELMTLPTGVVEQFLVQHSKMSELAPSAVNTVRVVTISSFSRDILEEGKHLDIAFFRLKMGGVNSLVDNLHGGGMVAAVDIEKGVLITDAVDGAGNVYSKHPGTGMEIKGFEIPFYDEVVKMVKEVIETKKLEGYLGWDIAITENGPELIELNLTPGVILYTIPYIIPEKKGLKAHMMRYLEN